ncbi:hypothetical protein V6Z12_A07G028000 [Gossypium hirsutum]
MYYFRWLLGFLHLLVWGSIILVHAIPPPDPVQCNRTICTLSNSYGAWGDRKDCSVKSVVYPTTEEELRSAVAHANKNKLKVKVVSQFSHTIPKLACPSSLGHHDSLLISTAKYDSSIEIDSVNLAVTADAGVALRDVIDKVEEAGLSLAAAPYWEGVSVAGMISTGAHGSSCMIVPGNESEGYAKVKQIGAQDQLLNAAKVSLGILGVISKKYEFGDITWYPSKHTAVYRYDSRVPMETPSDGINDFFGFQSNEILISKSVRASEKLFESTKSVNGECTLADTTLWYKKQIGNGLKNNGQIFTGYPVVGRQGKRQTSGSCLYSPKTRIDASYFIKDVKKLRDLKPENFCGIDHYNGFLIRYIKASKAYLGQSEDSIVVDFNYYRADEASTPRLNQDVMEEVEQMAFFKYGARPHWAKNRNLAFLKVQRLVYSEARVCRHSPSSSNL